MGNFFNIFKVKEKVKKLEIVCKNCGKTFYKFPAEFRKLCDICYEIVCRKEQKQKEKIYCKNREHNYLGVYHHCYEVIIWRCSKCGKEL